MEINKLKLLRGRAGLSLRELAALSGVNQSTISQLEVGHRKAQIATLGKLARALNCDLSELLEFMDDTASERGRKGAAVRFGSELGEFEAVA
jgi:transcriptional regulator with XRE-family HTH domain